jgi:hypothetical protein
VEASCDGLLIQTINCMSLCICNPATRQYAPLPLRYGTRLVGMYLHPPTGEYRLLLSSRHLDSQDGYHIFALGSGQPPRHIGIGCPIRRDWKKTLNLLCFVVACIGAHDK